MGKLIPQVRFPEFTEEWEKEIFGKFILQSAFGPRFSSDLYVKNGNTATLRTTDMDLDGNICYDSMPMANLDFEQIKDHILEPNDIVISRSGTIGITGVFKEFDKQVVPGAFLIRFRADTRSINTNYIKHKFNSEKIRHELNSLSAGGVQKNLTGTSVKQLEITIPSLPEQTKIANFLTAVDQKLTALNQKKTLLEQYKKGVMQQIFSQELRFKDDNGNDFPDWEEKKLGDVAQKKSSNISANKIEENIGDYIIYGASGILKMVDFYKEENDYVSIVKDGAGVGRLLYCNGKSSVLGTLEIIKPKKDLNTYFLFCLLNNIDFVKYVTGSTIPHIYFKDYSLEICGIPSVPEQTKIANFLSAIDVKINHCQEQIDQTTIWKKGLLQQMFV